jgi:hypothetical protein
MKRFGNEVYTWNLWKKALYITHAGYPLSLLAIIAGESPRLPDEVNRSTKSYLVTKQEVDSRGATPQQPS